jgi:hypothetical protein
MTIDEATKVLEILQAAFPHPPLTADRLKLYSAKLMRLDFKAATVAVDALTDDLDYFPTVAQLKRAIEAATPPAPALPHGTTPQRSGVFMYCCFDLEAGTYVRLPEPIPESSPEYARMTQRSFEAEREWKRRKRERAAEQAA